MKQTPKLTLIGAALACSAALAPTAYAGGIQLYEFGTPDVGLASAGWAARAQDAGTLFRNPAGLSLLSGTQFQTGLQLTYGDVRFSPDASTSPSLGGGTGGNAIGALPGGGLFLAHSLSDKLAIGFGTFSYFGLAQEYDQDWVGRYYAQKSTLLGLTLMPAASYKANDWLAFGAGLNAMYGYMRNDVALRTGAPGDGQLKLRDETWGFGANAGILVEPCRGTRLGVTYLSPVKLDFEDVPSFSNLGPLGALPLFTSPPSLDLGITVPQSVMFSTYHELDSQWAVMANLGWQNWNQFGQVGVGYDNSASLTKDLNYQDTWHGAVGVQYRATDKWLLSSGFAYDSSAVKDQDRTLALPMGEAYRIGIGAQYQLNQKAALGAAYEFMWAGDMAVTQESGYRGRVSGSYDNAWFSFFTLNLGVSF
jgi:long-chain fatty acid transport protein